jgi:hypothetical protein
VSRPTPAQAAFWPLLRQVDPSAPERFTPGKYRCPLCGREKGGGLRVGYDDREHEVTIHCFGGCDRNELRKALRVRSWSELRDYAAPRQGTPAGEFVYTDEVGTPLFRVCRWRNPAGQRYQHRDEHGDWAFSGKGAPKRPAVLYRAPEVVAAIAAEETVYFAATETDADAIRAHGGVATAIPDAPGRGGFRTEYAEGLRGAYVVVVAHKHEAGRERARLVAAALSGRAADARVVEPAIVKTGATAADHLDPASGRTLDDFAPLTSGGAEISGTTPAPPPRRTLAEVEQAFRAHHKHGDLVALRATLACYAANMYLDGDPVWLGLVAGSSTGKTETAHALAGCPGVLVASTLTGEAALLSGTAEKDRTAGATGGLLRQLGERGMLVLKDFTTVLSMHPDKRGAILSALREVYDGYWYRDVGTGGGGRLEWKGKLGLLMCSTGAYDRAHSVIALMGDRFLLIRLDDDEREAGARAALGTAGKDTAAREAIAEAAAGLLGHAPTAAPLEATDQDLDWLAKLADFVTLARSPVARDYKGDIELVLHPEGPYRFVKELYALWRACGLLGMDREQAWDVAWRVAGDSMPRLRWQAAAALATGGEQSTNSVARAALHPYRSTKRALEDLVAHGVAEKFTVAAEGGGTKDHWRLTDAYLPAAQLLAGVVPEISDPPQQDGPGTLLDPDDDPDDPRRFTR